MTDGKLNEFNVGEGDRAFGGILAHPVFINGQLYYYRRLCDDDLARIAGLKINEMIGCATGVAAIGLFAFNPDQRKDVELIQLMLVEPRKDVDSHNYSKSLYAKIASNQRIFDKKSIPTLFRELCAN
jgi:hypothetical protein